VAEGDTEERESTDHRRTVHLISELTHSWTQSWARFFIPRRSEGLQGMARTQWQRRRAVASTAHQLRTVTWIVLFAFVALDFALGGSFRFGWSSPPVSSSFSVAVLVSTRMPRIGCYAEFSSATTISPAPHSTGTHSRAFLTRVRRDRTAPATATATESGR
jgi:hypothetical protein